MSDEKKIIALVLVAYFLSDEVGFSLFFFIFFVEHLRRSSAKY